MEYAYKQALAVGMSPDQFWNLSLGEANDVIAARAKQNTEELKVRASLVLSMGTLAAFSVNDPKHMPTPHEMFPALFENKPTGQTNWQVLKARMLGYAAAKNTVMAGDEKNDGR